MPSSRSLLALSLVFYSFHASAFFTANADKPDPYARRHYTAADLPAAKRKVAAQKKAAAKKGPTDAEIMAEIEREDRGTEAANPSVEAPKITSHKIITPKFAAPQKREHSVMLKVESPTAIRDQAMLRKAGLSSDDLEGRRIVAAARGETYEGPGKPRAFQEVKTSGVPPVTVCRFSSLGGKQNRNSISSRYLISDSDGFDACKGHGGEVTAGNEDDRSLMNVKDSAILKRVKK